MTKHSVVVASASLPDRHGYFSLGTNADYSAAFIGQVPFFIEANAQMPRTAGHNQIHISQVAGWCEADYPLAETAPAAPNDRDLKIAQFITERVKNGACLQVGVGRIPNALLASLTDHKNLGAHTEALSDGVMDLVERGVITGSAKKQFRNKHVATFCIDPPDQRHRMGALPQ
jgi:acyl-CoA hydrolase